MQASMKSFVVFGVLISLCLVGCSSKPAGSQPGSRIDTPTAFGAETVAAPESSDDGIVTFEPAPAKIPDELVGSKITPPIIGQLKSRKHTILIHTASDGPRFTVTTHDGKVIAAALSVSEMQAMHPDIFKTYKESFANFESYLDASVHLDASSR